ncbi:MAG: leucine-rich repeat domain-containing protein [Prevotella sp.]|nr:leucine-rich repeat domain-containing protein [Prevotella sp.]
MKHIFTKYFFSFLLCIVGIKAEAYDCYVDGIYYNLNKDNHTASVTYLNIYPENSTIYVDKVIIPASISYDGDSYDVISIGHSAFYNCKKLTTVLLPNHLISIGSSAFYGCSDLKDITIPNTVSEIGGGAFYGCI